MFYSRIVIKVTFFKEFSLIWESFSSYYYFRNVLYVSRMDQPNLGNKSSNPLYKATRATLGVTALYRALELNSKNQ